MADLSGMDPDAYRADLIAMGATDEDADAAVKALHADQDGDR